MARPHERQGERRRAGALEVSGFRVVDEGPPGHAVPASPPRTRRRHLWHRWAVVRVDAHTTYVGCARCGRLRTPTVFESPVP
ncbi:hypothetical protein [Nocardioides flavus (ex Wang et al. 2016)]